MSTFIAFVVLFSIFMVIYAAVLVLYGRWRWCLCRYGICLDLSLPMIILWVVGALIAVASVIVEIICLVGSGVSFGLGFIAVFVTAIVMFLVLLHQAVIDNLTIKAKTFSLEGVAPEKVVELARAYLKIEEKYDGPETTVPVGDGCGIFDYVREVREMADQAVGLE